MSHGVVLSLASLAAALVLTQATPADRAIDAAVAAYKDIRTARASFEQAIRNPLLGSTLRSRGEFEQARPNRFAFRFTDPEGDVIVCDGRHVWVYLPSSAPGRVNRSTCGGDAAGSLDLIGEFFSSPRTRYTIGDGGAAKIGDRAVHIVELTPRDRDAAFVRARVWIDPSDGSLAQFEAHEPSGIVRLVTITRFDANVPVAESAFRFTPPKGVRIVDGR
jgi:outer membrane lipoprotein carrier protein